MLSKIKYIFSKLLKQASHHKFITGIIILLIIAGVYFGYNYLFKNKNSVRYATAVVEKGTLLVSVSGSGQVSASNQADIKPKTSGEITAIYVKQGQEVKAGALLAQLDASDAQRTVRDAETNLETAKLELDKLLEPADELSLLQSENSLIQAKESEQKAENDLKKTYESGFNNVSNAFLNLPAVMAGLQDILFSSSIGGNGLWNIDYYVNAVQTYDSAILQYRDDAYKNYQSSRKQYDQNFANYKSASRFSDNSTTEKLIDETYDTTKSIAEAIKSANNLIQFYKDKLTEKNIKSQPLADTYLSNLNSYTGTVNNYLSNLLSSQQSIEDSKNAIIGAERSIKERELSLAKIKAGPDELDIRAKNIAIQQKEDALASAKQSLADCYVRAPFDGIVAKVDAKKGDSASSGASILTFITKQKIAEISLNEVDVAKIKTAQKATLTFDAVENLSITGEVIEADTIGTISQGVVSYNIKIGFDTQDERIKPGMSLSAAVITDVKQNVLLVPNSAVKQQGNTAYVELVDSKSLNSVSAFANVSGAMLNISPSVQSVETGLSNDTYTEITNGLKEGDVVVTQTITSNSSQQSSSQQNSGFRIPGVSGGGGSTRTGGFSRPVND